MSDLTQLIADLEAAPEGSREYDARIWCAQHGLEFRHWDGEFCHYRDGVGAGMESHIPPASTSLDAALTLVEERCRWLMDKRPGAEHRSDGYRAHVWDGTTPTYESTETWAATPALALCIAALKARAQQSSTEDAA